MTLDYGFKLFGLEPGFTWEELCNAYQKAYEKASKEAEKGDKLSQFRLKEVDEAYTILTEHVYWEDDGIYHAPPKHPKPTDNRYVIGNY